MENHTDSFIRKRRFYMVVPLLVLPFLIMIFWALGGGQVTPARAEEKTSGLDLTLPDAHFSKERDAWNKLNYYQQAERDSARVKEASETDPYYVTGELTGDSGEQAAQVSDPADQVGHLNTNVDERSTDSIELRVNAKIRELHQQLEASSATTPQATTPTPTVSTQTQALSGDVQKLEQMMEMMNRGEEEDADMDQIQTVLDKILDIQHPERIEEKTRAQSRSHRGKVFPVMVGAQNDVSFFGSKRTTADTIVMNVKAGSAGFLALENRTSPSPAEPNAVRALIHELQELHAGSTVKIRLGQDIYINGIRIPKNDALIYGTCAINGERFNVSINSIQYQGTFMPVQLKVYDQDGLEGIHVAGTLEQDAARQGSNQAIQEMQLYNGLDTSLPTQLASSGIQAAKGLFARKSRQVKGYVKAGYLVWLKNNNDSQ